MKSRLTFFCFAITLGLGGCDAYRRDDMAIAVGKTLFEQHCAACHSIEGQGSIFKDYPPVKATALETLEIVHRVTVSQPENRKMPTFTDLSEADAELIARFVKTL